MPVWAGNMVESEASTFPLANLTKVSTAAHSTQYFVISILNGLIDRGRHFGALLSSILGILVAPTGAGLIFISVPASPASTDRGRDSPSYSGFFHCLAVSDDQRSPCFSPNSCVLQNIRNASPRVFLTMCWFLVHPVQLVFYLHVYLFANKFIAEIYSVFSCI